MMEGNGSNKNCISRLISPSLSLSVVGTKSKEGGKDSEWENLLLFVATHLDFLSFHNSVFLFPLFLLLPFLSLSLSFLNFLSDTESKIFPFPWSQNLLQTVRMSDGFNSLWRTSSFLLIQRWSEEEEETDAFQTVWFKLNRLKQIETVEEEWIKGQRKEELVCLEGCFRF